MGQKQFFLNILKRFVINSYWICSIMKIYIICCVPAQIPHLEKFWFLRYGQKCSQPIRLQVFLINHISGINQWNSLLFCGYDQKWVWLIWSRDFEELIQVMDWFCACWWKFRKAKSCFSDLWVGSVKNGHVHLIHDTLKFAEWVYGLSWFFACWLWCNNFLLDQHRTFYFWLLNANLLQLYILVSPLGVAGRILWNSVCPSFPPYICLCGFLEYDH